MSYERQIILFPILAAFFISFFWKTKASIFARLLFFYICASSIYFSNYYHHHYLGEKSASILRFYASNSFYYFILSVLFAYILNLKTLIKSIVYIEFLNSAILVGKFLLTGIPPYFLCLNSSTEGTLLAIMMPFFLFTNCIPKYLKIIPIIAAIITTSSIGIFGTVISIIVYYIRSAKMAIYPIFSCIAFFAICYFYAGNQIFSSSGRLEKWMMDFNYFINNQNIFFGTGIGSYRGFGPYVQQLNGINKHFYIYAHSDFFQVFFEFGIIGLALLILTTFDLFKKSYKDPLSLSLLTTFAFTSLLNMPFRYPLTLLAGLTISRMIFEKRK